ncbi:helix-turn-helix transcriptional regulator [Flavobacterium sp. UBA6195]|uniref:helix-turn-helix transcriptional regulator n=1 Tax=Flavobacterium sp. UBA6195 TaxID=1946554 RepID=UPI0025C097BF|nr:hypothetical protein [Flavobacterium sp. UBA6195]
MYSGFKFQIFSNDYYKNIRRYLFFLSLIYLYYFYIFLIQDGLSLNCLVYFFTFLFTFLTIFLLKKKFLSVEIFKRLALIFIIYLNFLHYLVAYSLNFTVNNIYFQFSIITSIPIIFDFKTDKRKIFIIIFTTLVFFVIHGVSQIYLHLKSNDLTIDVNFHNLSSILISMVVIGHNLSFLYLRERHFSKLVINKKINSTSENNVQELNSKDLEELIEIAKINNILFLEKFEIIYPDFFNTELFHDKDLTVNELYICALTKLGLNTKDIAQISNTTPKSVESRKYRIKKKLNLTEKFSVYFISS